MCGILYFNERGESVDVGIHGHSKSKLIENEYVVACGEWNFKMSHMSLSLRG